MAHKNDYTCIVYFPEGRPKKWTYVHGLLGFAKFLDNKHPNWNYFNVYDRRNGQYLKRFYKGNFIPYFLPMLIFALGWSFFLTFNNPNTSLHLTFINGLNNTATISTQYLPKGGEA
jgi:hypothetical protein